MRDPLGVVLAGGLGRRMGGGKATLQLKGRPLISYPVTALSAALGAVAVVAKRDSKLPRLPGVEVLIEPDEPRHPIMGIVHALRAAGARPVVVCALDLPLVDEDLVAALAFAERGAEPATVARGDGRLQPTLARYDPAALEALSAALQKPDQALTDAVLGLDPRLFDVPDPEQLFNVNTPEDLARAEAILERRRRSPSGEGSLSRR